MTEIKDNQEGVRKVKYKINQKDKEKKLKRKNSFLICNWILLTVGLCIIVETFYVVIRQSYFFANADEVSESYTVLRAFSSVQDDNSDFVQSSVPGTNEISKIIERPNYIRNEIKSIPNHCQENLCKIACANVANISTTLFDTIKHSLCPSIETLLLEKQEFPFGVLRNFWLPFNISINEVIIRFSKIVVIKNNAFNSPLFKDTLVLSLYYMNLGNVESGALLGLYRLQYLTIQCRIQRFQPAILQPVQTTLMHLKLNAHLQINADKNPFVVSFFNKLIYLDLSHNIFNGSLSKEFFKSTPNLKYLIITESEIQHIEKDAFENLIEKLLFVNLSNNLLTNLAADLFRPILVSQRTAMINLSKNKWICDCQLQELAELYKLYHSQFIDALYCTSPRHVYGVSLAEVDLSQKNCLIAGATIIDQLEETKPKTVTEPGRFSTQSTTVLNPYQGIDNNDKGSSNSNNLETVKNTKVLKMRCVESKTPESKTTDKRLKDKLLNDQRNYLNIETLSDSFELKLIPENNSVIVKIDTFRNYFVIWFSDQLETSTVTYNGTCFDYECMLVLESELIVGPLKDNTTYTFCLLPYFRNNISPLHCLPLHVPSQRNENVWISEDRKHFTIGMLCLIFLLSTVAGALIAYFGIKTYPDILEGSKNVLIIKKPDEVRYVATISGIEHQKHSSLKKRRNSSTMEPNLNRLSLPETPTFDASPLPFCMSGNDLDKLSCSKSSSTSFEDKVTVCCFVGDEYEMPNEYNSDYVVEQRMAPSAYFTTPGSPPPLPKRNSCASNSQCII